MDHTPVPWRVREHPQSAEEFFISAPRPKGHPYENVTKEIEVMSDERYPTKRADADFIVLAVNAHKEMLVALEVALQWCAGEVRSQLLAAIAKGKGRA